MKGISVIISTHNRAKLLENTLSSLAKQKFNKELFEIIVADNASCDDTQKVTESYFDKFSKIKYIYYPEAGLHYARNAGYLNASYDILAYLDDDMQIAENWLQIIFNEFQDEEIVMCGGKILPIFETEPPDWLMQKWNKANKNERILGTLGLIDLGDVRKEINPFHVFGGNMAVKKSIIEIAQGFNPDSLPADKIRYRGDGESHISNYIKKHRLKTMYNPEMSATQFIPASKTTQEYFIKRSYNQGVSDSFTSIRKNRGINNNDKNYPLLLNIKKKIIKLLTKKTIEQNTNKAKEEVVKSDFEKKMEQSYRDGLSFHRNMYGSDNSVREWVLKDNYLDFKLPLKIISNK